MVHRRQLDIKKIADRDDLVVWFHEGKGSRLVVAFSGIGRDGDAVQDVEFAVVATMAGEGHALFIIDPNRTWLNGPQLIEKTVTVIEHYVAKLGVTEVVTMGHSMGGYNAALIAAFTKVDIALSLAPQTSVHPEVVGDDYRWLLLRGRIETHLVRSLADHINPATKYIAVFGDRPREAPQFRRFPEGDNIEVLMLPRRGHGVAQTMKVNHILDKVAWAAFDRDFEGLRAILRDKMDAYPRTPEQINYDPAILPEKAVLRVEAEIAERELMEKDD